MMKEPKRISGRALDRLMDYDWPGNVRELENKIKRLVALVTRKLIYEEDLPKALQGSNIGYMTQLSRSFRTLRQRVEEVEKRTIMETLETCRHNQLHTAKLLGLSRQGLINKMKRYGIIK